MQNESSEIVRDLFYLIGLIFICIGLMSYGCSYNNAQVAQEAIKSGCSQEVINTRVIWKCTKNSKVFL